MIPARCPYCSGTKVLPDLRLPNSSFNGPITEPCRNCNENGMVCSLCFERQCDVHFDHDLELCVKCQRQRINCICDSYFYK